MRPAAAVLVAVMLVLAGCSGASPQAPDGNATATTTTTTDTTETTDATTRTTRDGPDLGINVQGGELPFDPNVTFLRVQEMLGTNVSPPGNVMYVPGLDSAGQASNTGRVYLDTKDEAVLAHEFAHSILLRAAPEGAVGSPDAEFAGKATVEGAAEYVEAAYEQRYLDRTPSPVDSLPRNPEAAYFLGRYHYGYDYFEARVDDPSEVGAVHGNPPNTSEQVLHGLAPAEEPPREFLVSTADRHLASDATWQYAGSDRLGEITLLLTLRTRLPSERAAAAASGWGNDRLVTFEGDDGRGFAWVIRWDDAANATEFAETFREYEGKPVKTFGSTPGYGQSPNAEFTQVAWHDTDASMTVTRLSPEVTVVAIGPESFVEQASASGGNESVTVRVE
jgi:hypothetical protein